MIHTITSGAELPVPSLGNADSVPWILAACAGTSLLMLALVRLLKLDLPVKALLLAQPSRTEIVTRLEQLAEFSRSGNQRAARRVGDQCSWRLLRLGADLLAEGAQPAEIAHKLERTAEILATRKIRLLRRIAAFACGLVAFPLGVLLIHMLGVFGAVAPTSGWVTGLAFVFAISLLLVSSATRLLCERAEDSVAQRTIEVEALIFGLSAIRGGASPEEVGSLSRMVLGMAPARSPLRRAA